MHKRIGKGGNRDDILNVEYELVKALAGQLDAIARVSAAHAPCSQEMMPIRHRRDQQSQPC